MEELRFQKNQKSKNREIIKSSIIILFAIIILVIQTNQITIIISTLFVILGVYLIYSSLRKKKDTVIISEKGILSSVNGMSLIKWEHIKDFEIKNAVNAKVLVVNIRDTDKLLYEMNKVSKQLMRTNIKKLGSPVVIPESEFNNSMEEVKNKIENYKNSL